MILRQHAASTIAFTHSPVFYSEPWVDMHNRMKEALVLLGRQKRAVVRPPLTKIDDAEIARIRQALVESGLLRQKANAA